jgi:protein-L-isoaspartate(D-aspartate) O-methyltransferase
MVAFQIRGRGIRDTAVLKAMAEVPRHEFVPPPYQAQAYADTPLPLPCGQTISQPFVVAYMIEALQLPAGCRVLEIGTGSGYAAAVLAEIATEVYGVEREAHLVTYAREHLARLGYQNVWIKQGDGTLGWPEHGPYEGIVVAAGGPHIPPPLKEQLALGGHLVIPVGKRRSAQELVRVTRVDELVYVQEDLGPVRFVPLVGEEGWT